MEPEVIYKPFPWQALAHSCPCLELLAEGNRGGGKSDYMLMDYCQGLGKGFGPAYRGIIIRREQKDLQTIIDKSFRYFKRLFPDAIYNKSTKTWTFIGPQLTGETLQFVQAYDERDYWNFHGHEIPFIGWDELTSWPTPELYLSMFSCLRSSVPGMPKKMRATSNPWGPGHSWVKERFIDIAPNGVPVQDEVGQWRVRINAMLSENVVLLKNDPDYIAKLNQTKNPLKRKAWIDGDWGIQIGAFFGECWSTKNIIEPFAPPSHWLKWRAFDWGFAKPFSVGWFCMSDGTSLPDGRIYPRGAIIRYKEWYGADKTEQDTGLRLSVSEIARGIKERDGLDKIDYSVADPAIFSENGGKSQAEQFYDCGIKFEKGDNSRIAGWELMRERMGRNDSNQTAMFYVAKNCIDFIRLIPVLLFDERKPEDLDTTAEDHIADECRYGIMTRPWVRDVTKAVSTTAMSSKDLKAKWRKQAAAKSGW